MSSTPGSGAHPPSAALEPLELICFGPPTARLSGRAPPADVLWRKHLALLVYLALSPQHAHTREHLIGLLWPEKQQTYARRSFTEALRRLRKSLGPDRITTEGSTVALNMDGVRVDALVAQSASASDALVAMRGDFLEGWALEDAQEFEQWVTSQRSAFHARARDLLVASGETALEQMDFPAAEDAARRVLDLEPYSERAVRLLMLGQVLAGDAVQGLATFSQFAARLESEIGEQPSRELTDLHDRVSTGRWRRQAARGGDAVDAPMVGRATVHQSVFSQCRQGLEAGPRVVVITGAPGYGRTRLLEECMQRVRLDGAVTAAARPLENDLDAPYSTLRMLLQTELASAPGLVGSPSDALGVLTAIEPQFAPQVSAIEPRDSSHVATALRACIRAVTDEQPLGIGIDDAHYADGATLIALSAALRELESVPFVVVLSAPVGTTETPRELLALRTELGRGVPGAVTELTPLDLSDVQRLVEGLAPWCPDPEQQHRLARRLNFEARGNPLFLVTLLRALREESELRDDLMVWPVPRVTLTTPLPVAIPDVIRSAVAIRIDALDDQAAQVLKAASILGQGVHPGLIASTLDMPEAHVEQGLVALENAGFVVYSGSRPTLAAPLIAKVIRDLCLTRGERSRMQVRALDALENFPDLASKVNRARVLADVGRDSEALSVALDAASEALDLGGARTARRSIEVAARVSKPQGQAVLRELEERLAKKEASPE